MVFMPTKLFRGENPHKEFLTDIISDPGSAPECLRPARFHSEIRALVLALMLALVLASLVKTRLN